MSDFVTIAKDILQAENTHTTAPGFIERLELAASPDSDSSKSRSIRAPYYLTDLGVRYFEDPRIFFDQNQSLIGWNVENLAEDSEHTLLDIPVAQLGNYLDRFILMVGDYKTAADVVTKRLEEILESGNYETQLNSGVLLAAVSNRNSLKLLDHAAHHPDVSQSNQFMAIHRLAAAQIKRFHRPTIGMELLEALDNDIHSYQTEENISSSDIDVLLSVTANLRALALFQLKRWEEAAKEVKRSQALATVEGLQIVDPSESARYSAQENINAAQLSLYKGQFDSAVMQLSNNVNFCMKNAPDYLSEALSALSYAQLRQGNLCQAIACGYEALGLIADEASPKRLAATREFVVAAYHLSGDVEATEIALWFLDNDPLGLQVKEQTQRLAV